MSESYLNRRRAYWIAWFKLMRLPNVGIIIFAQYATAILQPGPENQSLSRLLDPGLLAVVVSTALIAGGGYVINDYFDVRTDIINKPRRLFIGRLISRRSAILAHLFLTTVGVFMVLPVSLPVFVVNAIAATLLLIYSAFLKRQPLVGNFTISLLTGLSVAVVAIYFKERPMPVYSFAVFAFFVTLIRELIKDLEDQKGDAAVGAQTLPIIWGPRRVKYFIYVVTVVFVLALGITAYKIFPRLFYFGAILVPAVVFLLVMLHRADTSAAYHKLSTYLKYIMVLGIISMLVL